MKRTVLHIPMLPYLRKYLLAQSENRIEPMVFRRKSEYNLLLHRLVTNYYKLGCNHGEPPTLFHRTAAPSGMQITRIVLRYNERKNILSYNFLSRDNRYKFVSEVKLDFYLDFRRHLRRRLMEGMDRKTAVLEFMDRYNLSENDIKFESLYRYSSRELARMKSNKNF